SASFNSFNEVTGGQFQATFSGIHWYNNDASAGGSFGVRINASDAGGSGVNYVSFPAYGAGWSRNPVGGNDTTGTPFYEAIYTWTGAAAQPGTLSATAVDLAGNSANVSFPVQADTSAPSPG